MVILLNISKIDLLVSREGNGVLGNYYRISAYDGDSYIGEEIYAGYSKRESMQRARESVREKGGLGIWARR
jgi:hypothetical protein